MSPNLTRRLTKLEEASKPSDRPTVLDLAKALSKDPTHLFVGEPDHPEAVRELVEAVREVVASNPPFKRPGHIKKGSVQDELFREWAWIETFPEVASRLEWLGEMMLRVREGRPPISEAEFRDFEAWYYENEDRIPPDEGIDLGIVRRLTRSQIRQGLCKGPRAYGVTKLVEDLRKLRCFLTH